MDANNLKKNGHLLLEYFAQNGYKPSYILKVRQIVKKVIESGSNENIKTYEDLFFHLTQNKRYSKNTIYGYRSIIGIIRDFDFLSSNRKRNR